jgi:amylosucrase
MGDEIGLLNDHSYEADPHLAHDGRWMHRPPMDWTRAEKRHDRSAVEGRIFNGILHILARRRATPHIHAANPTDILETGVAGVFAFARRSPIGSLVCLYNFSGTWREVPAQTLRQAGVDRFFDELGENVVTLQNGALLFPPEGRVWLT